MSTRAVTDSGVRSRGIRVLRGGAVCGLLLGLVWAGCAAPSTDSAREVAPEVSPDPRLDGLTAFIESSFDDWNIPGLAVGVVVDDRLAYAQGFGVKEVGRTDPIDATTLFQIGSVTKSFGAGTIAALVDEGLAAFDDPLVTHLPWFTLTDSVRAAQITLRDLVSHRSGVPEDAYAALEVIDGTSVARRAARLENYGPYGEYRYSNFGYGLVSLTVESATGESWGDWLEARIFAPLGMDDSHASPYGVWEPRFVAPTFLGTAPAGNVGIEDAPAANVAMPHGFDRDGARRVLPWQSYDNMQAAGSVVSNAVDMSRWLRMHLAEGRFEGREIFAPATAAELTTEQVDVPGTFLFADGQESSYAMGWSIGSFGGHRYVSHGGGIFGFPAYAAMLPEIEAGVVVLVNGSMWTPYYPHHEIVAFVFSELLDLPARDYHAEAMAATEEIHARVDQALAALDAQRNLDAAPSLDLDGYAGTFRNDALETVHVLASPEGLRLSFDAEGSFSGTLEPWNGDTFLLRYDGGDGQAYGQSPVVFTLTDAEVTEIDLGRFGRFGRAGG